MSLNHKNSKYLTMSVLCAAVASASTAQAAPAGNYINLGGIGTTSTGYAAAVGYKSGETQNDIEGKDGMGNPSTNHNGLPDHANFLVPAGFEGAGNYTAIVAGPLSASSDYQPILDEFYGGLSSTVINNQTVTQSDFATMSAGYIDYNDGDITGIGTEVIAAGDLTFNFNTYDWDGEMIGDGGDATSTGDNNPFSVAPDFISPFSPVYTPYNDSNGSGNAPLAYKLSIDNVSGTGLTFTNGVLTDMDIMGDITVEISAPVSSFITPDEVTGTFTASGLDYSFDVKGEFSLFFIGSGGFLLNRAGEVSAVPVPAAIWLFGSGLLGLVGLARRKNVQ